MVSLSYTASLTMLVMLGTDSGYQISVLNCGRMPCLVGDSTVIILVLKGLAPATCSLHTASVLAFWAMVLPSMMGRSSHLYTVHTMYFHSLRITGTDSTMSDRSPPLAISSACSASSSFCSSWNTGLSPGPSTVTEIFR